MPIPDRPDPDDIVASAWGQWVHDNLATPRRFRLWRTTSVALGVDGINAVAMEQKDDPYAMVSGTSQFRAPVAGVVAFAGAAEVAFSPAGAVGHYAALFVNGAEGRRGSRVTATASVLASQVAAVLKVAAGDLVDLRVYASGGGITKTLTGGVAITYLEGCYLGNGL